MTEHGRRTILDLRALNARRVLVLLLTVVAVVGALDVASITICAYVGCVALVESQWFVAAVTLGIMLAFKPILRAWEQRPRIMIAACVITYLVLCGWGIAAKAGLFRDLEHGSSLAATNDTIATILTHDSSGATWECHREPSLSRSERSPWVYVCDNGREITVSRDGRVLSVSDHEKNRPIRDLP